MDLNPTPEHQMVRIRRPDCRDNRDNRTQLSPTWTDPINSPGSRNPLRTSYVKQDGESIKRKGRRSEAGTIHKQV